MNEARNQLAHNLSIIMPHLSASESHAIVADWLSDISLLTEAIGATKEKRMLCKYWNEPAYKGFCRLTEKCPGPHVRLERWVTLWQEVTE